MSSGSQTSSSTSSSTPWEPSQGYLTDAMKKADNLMDKDKGFNPYPEGSYTGMSSQTQTGLNMTQDLASQPNQFYQPSADFTSGLIGGQYNLDQSGYQALQGQGPSTEGGYRSMFDNVNTEFDKVVQDTTDDIADQYARTFGGSSFGSGQNVNYMTDAIGDVSSQMRSDNFYNNQNLQKGLLDSVTGVQQMNFDNQRGLLGDMSNLSQQDIANRQAGVAQADSVYNSQYLPAQQMSAVGAAYDADAAAKRQSDMDVWNANQQAEWERLASAYGIFGGTGQQGNSISTTTSTPTDPWSQILGGGLLASQIKF